LKFTWLITSTQNLNATAKGALFVIVKVPSILFYSSIKSGYRYYLVIDIIITLSSIIISAQLV